MPPASKNLHTSDRSDSEQRMRQTQTGPLGCLMQMASDLASFHSHDRRTRTYERQKY